MNNADNILLDDLKRQNELLVAALAAKENDIQNMNLIIDEKDIIIQSKDTIIQDKDTIIQDKDAIIRDKDAIIEENEVIIKKNELRINDLCHIIIQLRKMKFGSSRERFISKGIDPNQLTLGFDFGQEQIEKSIEKEKVSFERENKPKKKHSGREKLPKHLPVVERILEPENKVEGAIKIGEEITEELACLPSVYYILRTTRNKYITPEDDRGFQKQLIAQLNRPIPKCIAHSSLLATIVVDKYIYHLPLYRQLKRFTQMKIHINASTMDSWMKLIVELLTPLYAIHRMDVLNNKYMQVDESTIRVLDRDKKGKTHLGYMWVYSSVLHKSILFDYKKGRGSEAPKESLTGFEGFLQTDGYAVYDHYGGQNNVTHVSCWAHARRYFDKALKNDPVHASHILTLIQQLYAIEDKARTEELSYDQRHKLRLDHALPILNDIGKYIANHNATALPKSPIGEAFNYCIARWDKLNNYLKEGYLEIDNNIIENAIRPLALGRKNYLFAGSDNGAKYAAMFYSFFATCAKHNINPLNWMLYVLENINDTKITELRDLLPQRINPELVSDMNKLIPNVDIKLSN